MGQESLFLRDVGLGAAARGCPCEGPYGVAVMVRRRCECRLLCCMECGVELVVGLLQVDADAARRRRMLRSASSASAARMPRMRSVRSTARRVSMVGVRVVLGVLLSSRTTREGRRGIVVGLVLLLG